MSVKAPVHLSRRGMIGLVVTVLVTGALMLLLAVRLVNASSAVNDAAGSPLIGHPAPAFAITLWNESSGQKLTLAELKGKPIVLNFWASWCDPCQEEAPVLEAAARQYASQGVAFVGVAYEDTRQNAMTFAQQQGVTYPIGPDSSGTIAIAYGVQGVPETVFIDRGGTINFKFGGALDARTLNQHIQAILK